MTETSLALSLVTCAISIILALSIILIFYASKQCDRKLLMGVSLPVLVFFLGLLVASVTNFAVVGGQVVVVRRTFMMFFLFLVLIEEGDTSCGRFGLQGLLFAAMLFVTTDVLIGLFELRYCADNGRTF